MKTRHNFDCTIYACLHNQNPEFGICTCGFGREVFVQSGGADYSELYSEELKVKLKRGRVSERKATRRIESLFPGLGEENEHPVNS